jgi:UDP-N-acetylglucosamine--N-acetylmuramyl-(pentapeptide) pyrophosphoryl-undecaprenol N-acetylglucosamine transferase
MNKTICFVAGVSGGHIIPAVTLAYDEFKKNPSARIVFFSTTSDLDQKILNTCGKMHHIMLTVSPVPRHWWLLPFWCAKMIKIGLWCWWWFLWHRPKKLVSTGGLISVPVCLAAWCARIPFDLYELNAVPGKAVTFLASYARTICTTMVQAKARLSFSTCSHVAYPLRYTKADKIDCHTARISLGLAPHLFTILVLGGSQGSHTLNILMQQFIERHRTLSAFPFQIIHQTGEADQEVIRQWYSRYDVPALVFAYRPDIARCYNAADCVIARAGAGTLFELQFFEKMSLIIPLETQWNDHQVDNAYAMQTSYPALFKVLRYAELEKNPKIFDTSLYAVGHVEGFSPKTA